MSSGAPMMNNIGENAAYGHSGYYGDEITYMSGLLTFYLKGRIQWNADAVNFQIPNTILGFIPLGKHAQSLPVQHITNCAIDFRVKIGKIIFGLILAIISIGCFSTIGNSPLSALLLGLIFLLLAASSVIDALETTMLLTQASGHTLGVDFLIFDKKKAEFAAGSINEMVVGRSQDTNMRVHLENQTMQQAMLQQQMLAQQTMQQQQMMAMQTNAIVGALQQNAVVNAIGQQQLAQGIAQNQAQPYAAIPQNAGAAPQNPTVAPQQPQAYNPAAVPPVQQAYDQGAAAPVQQNPNPVPSDVPVQPLSNPAPAAAPMQQPYTADTAAAPVQQSPNSDPAAAPVAPTVTEAAAETISPVQPVDGGVQ